MSESRLLSDIRVVEVATMVFAPSACAAMADFGAQVIKVEPPGTGDLNRHYHQLPGMPASELPYTFQIDNRLKRSVALDFKTDSGYAILRKLVSAADVFVTNLRPAALARRKLTYADLNADHPRLIYGLATAYGEEGGECDKPGYDSVCYWARSAIESQVFPVDGWLGPFPFGSGDHASGTALFAGIMTALYQREKTGRGCKVSSSLLANGAWANATMLQAQLCDAKFNDRQPRDQSYNFTYIHYRTADDRVLKLSIVDADKDWQPFCRAIGREEFITDERFAELNQRVENMATLIHLIDKAFLEHPIDYWQTRLAEFDIPYAILPTYPEAADDPQKAANDIVVPLQHERFGEVRTISSPINIEGYQKRQPNAAPELGEHTCEVLAELGCSDQEIQQLIDDGVAQASSR